VSTGRSESEKSKQYSVIACVCVCAPKGDGFSCFVLQEEGNTALAREMFQNALKIQKTDKAYTGEKRPRLFNRRKYI
jgi:hypothetical protein